jgi:hypothetical protein
MEDINYTVRFTDNTVENKNPIKIAPNVVNKTTGLLLHGRGSPNFGEDLWGNLIRLLENFCSKSVEPSNPTEGQLWFNASTKELSVYTRIGINEYKWNKILIDGVPNGLLTDVDLAEYLKDFVKKSGDTMIGSLTIPSDLGIDNKPTVTNDLNKFNAVTRKYVDYYVDDIKKLLPDTTQGGTVDDYIVRTAGASKDKRTMVDYLILPSEFKDTVGLELKDDFTDDHYAVSKRYVDANIKDIPKLPKPLKANSVLHIKNDGTTIEWDDTAYLKLSGGTMGGVLSLIDDDYNSTTKIYSLPSLKIAASRQYVQDYLEKNKFALPSGDNGKFLKKNDTSGELEWSSILAGITEGTLAESGYVKLGGLLSLQICWGNFTPLADGKASYTFSHPFTNNIFAVLLTVDYNTSDTINNIFEKDCRISTKTITGFDYYYLSTGDHAGQLSPMSRVQYIAIGN